LRPVVLLPAALTCNQSINQSMQTFVNYTVIDIIAESEVLAATSQ